MALKRPAFAERLSSVRGRSKNHPDQLIEAALNSAAYVSVSGLVRARVLNPAERNGRNPAIEGTVGGLTARPPASRLPANPAARPLLSGRRNK